MIFQQQIIHCLNSCRIGIHGQSCLLLFGLRLPTTALIATKMEYYLNFRNVASLDQSTSSHRKFCPFFGGYLTRVRVIWDISIQIKMILLHCDHEWSINYLFAVLFLCLEKVIHQIYHELLLHVVVGLQNTKIKHFILIMVHGAFLFFHCNSDGSVIFSGWV